MRLQRVAGSLCILSMLVVVPAVADRISPKEVPSIERDGITYKVLHFGGFMGFVEAHVSKTDELIWRRQIYVVKYQPGLEPDVQDCFITSIEIEDNKMIIKNEILYEYELDLTSLEVKVVKGTLVICRGK